MATETLTPRRQKSLEETKKMYERYAKFSRDYFQPSLKVLSEHIGINYVIFRQFTTQNKVLGQQSLTKIDKFLSEQGY